MTKRIKVSQRKGGWQKNYDTLKEFSEILHGTESSVCKMSEADLNLERSRVHQTQQTESLHTVRCDKKASTVQTTLDMFYTNKSDMLSVSASNVLN